MKFKDIFEFNDLIYQISDRLNWYERGNGEDIRYRLYMSNGEMINIEFSKQSIPHLLGIDIDYLRGTGLYKGSAYSILEDIIANPTRLYKQIKNNNINPGHIFSEHIYQKLNNFKTICSINIFNIEFIVNYKSHNSYITGEQKLDGDYYIATRIDDTLSIIGLKENGNVYKPLTNVQLTRDDDDTEKYLNRLLTNQILTSAQSLKRIRYTDFYEPDEKNFHYYNEQKIEKLKLLEEYAEKYNCPIVTNKDCLFFIQKAENLYDEKKSFCQILSEITEKMQQSENISYQGIEERHGAMAGRFKNMILLHNYRLKNSAQSDNAETHLNLAYELENSKKEILRLQKLQDKLEEKNEQLVGQINDLKEENTDFKNREEAIKNILIKR